ncbi:amino acid adenylation domain-containing protein [Pectobacterium brasiliense]|uniref:non-ribosomal peptide synthetase n=1 Tax=Pectobacterium brasiliense TaxID=180957 RepID=UPI001968B687|nr:non-ribosomal peptide synthetase [Pectobacterium brasiliense]MBN3254947.1 amino acid adenylation domain-containing protein [Pectobacterium brasiliense]
MKPLSVAQRGLWLGHALNDDKATFNTAECIAFDGKVDIEAMLSAIRQAVMECECLYCQFVEVAGEHADQPEIGFVASQLPVPIGVLPIIELLPAPMKDEEQTIRQWAREEIAQPLDLLNGLPCRFALLCGEKRDFLYSCVHHMALDGFGTTMLFQRIAQIYTALTAGQPVAVAEFGPFSEVLEEEQQRDASGQTAQARDFWLETLNAMPEPASFSEKKAPIAARFLRQSSVLPTNIWQPLTALCEGNKISWPDLFLAMLATHLKLVSGSDRLTFGMMVMNRIGSASLTVPSMQMNIVPLCIQVDEQADFVTLAQQVARTKRTLRRHQHYRYEHLRRDLNRVGGEQRLFGPLINIMPFDHPLSYGLLSSSTLNLSAGPVEDLTIEIHFKPDGTPVLDFDANPACYSAEALANLQETLFTLLQRWLAQPQQTSGELLGRWLREERELALITSREPEPFVEPALTAIAKQARKNPHHPALTQRDRQYSYQQLLDLSGQAAAALHERGVQPGERIGIMLNRSPETIICLLAVMQCGAVYVPLDPEQPHERQQHIIQIAGLRTIVTQADYQHRLASVFSGEIVLAGHLLSSNAQAAALPPVEARDGQIAYVMFTSGSTGLPKGVEIGASALDHFTAAARQRYGLRAADRVLQFAPFNFDASIEEIFATLTSGATLVLRTDEMLESIPTFVEQVEEQAITLLDLPTAFWNEWVVGLKTGTLTMPSALRAIIIGGEAVYPEQLAQWQRHAPNTLRLINTYGPTETTVVATSCDLQTQSADVAQLPIGLPLAGVNALILAAGDRPAAEGELVLLGPTLAAGYIGTEHTAFTQIAVGDQDLPAYRTGDRVRLEKGQLLYLGRMDNEFKISGYRIQPGEVEAHLLAQPDVDEACVQGIVYPNGVRRLVAFVATKAGEIDARALKQRLGSVLPPAMIPTDYRAFRQLPKTGSNKVDRKRLLAEYRDEAPAQALASETENRVSAIWQQILGVSGIQSRDNFFELGGQSLQTIQIVNRLAAEFSVSIKVSDVFDHPQLSDFCRYLDDRLSQDENSVEMVW